MIWAEAEGCRVVVSNGREYLDLSGGSGVAALGRRKEGRYLSATPPLTITDEEIDGALERIG